MRFTSIYLSFLLIGCSHPEGKSFERNQGNKIPTDIPSEDPKTRDNDLDNANFLHNNATLKMDIENGVRYVWIEINGIKLRFIFDTGASSICISPAEATVLYRQGTLLEEDILNAEYFQDATGRISEGTTINLRKVRIGNMELENVKALIVDNVNAPLLLGQTVLERFGSIEIDNVNNEIRFK
jgi:aspartyl protease family protein